MMPDNETSLEPVSASFLLPEYTNPLIDYEWGGFDLYDASQGLSKQIWSCFYEDGQIKISNNVVTHSLLTVADVQSLSLAFDSNMRPMIAYSTEFDNFLYWYDSSITAQIVTKLENTYSFLKLSLDDTRLAQATNADVILAYINKNKLCMRIQRDRFQIEYEIAKAKQLNQIGMMRNNRFGFAFYNW